MKKIILSLAIFGFFCLGAMAQEKVYMPYFEVINMHKDYQKTATRLLKMYFDAGTKMSVVVPANDSTYFKETKEQSLAKAKSLNINHVLIGELNRVGETVIVSVALYKTESGDKEWSAIQKAQNPDDLDPIMQKLAASIADRSTLTESDNIYNVTDYNSKQLNKMNATTYFGLEIGGGPVNIGNTTKFPAGFSAIYSGDLRTLLFDIKGSLYFSDIHIAALSVNVNYPLYSKTATPYFGGGLGFGTTDLDMNSSPLTPNENYSGNGLILYANAGYIFTRTSNINLRLNGSFFVSTYQVNHSLPIGFTLGLAVLF